MEGAGRLRVVWYTVRVCTSGTPQTRSEMSEARIKQPGAHTYESTEFKVLVWCAGGLANALTARGPASDEMMPEICSKKLLARCDGD